jgi:hypothetical protein
VDGSLQPSESHTYVLWARAGQTMSVRILPPSPGDPKAILIIWGEDGVPLITDHASATEWEGELPSSQDYFIRVHANPETAITYTLEIVIPPPGPEEPVPERIRFPEGATSTEVDGSLEPSEANVYVLWAAAGQTMSVRILPPSPGDPRAILIIWGEDGVPLITDHASATEWEDELPRSQDYFIQVQANPETAVSYTLEIVIPPLSDGEPVPERIRFAEGATSTTVEGSLSPSETDRYVLWAAAGQTLSLRLLPPPSGEPDAILVVWGEDGVPLITDHAAATEFEGELLASQSYYIDVRANPTSSVDYMLEVIIPPASG